MTKPLLFHPVRAILPAPTATFTVVPFAVTPTAADRCRAAAAATERRAPATGLFARLERETDAGSLPETLAFALLGVTGAAWPAWEVLRLVFTF